MQADVARAKTAMDNELIYLLLIFGLLVIPRALQRFKLPAPITCLLLGLGAVLLWGHRSVTDLSYDIIFFGLRATLAAVFTLMHMQWLRGAMDALEAEGALRS